jgi:hypothetical protein
VVLREIEYATGAVTDGPQLAGKACVHCACKLLGNFEGRACGGCGGAVHRDCYRAHRDAAHPKVGGYRDSPR